MNRDVPTEEPRSLWTDAWAALRENRAAVVAFWVLAALTLIVLVAPVLLPFSYEQRVAKKELT